MSDEALTIIKGKTYQRVLHWEVKPLVYKAISNITQAGPAVITAASHGVPDGWQVAVIGVSGMRQINAKNWPLRTSDWNEATVTDANTVELNAVNATAYDAYTSGGYLVYYTPQSLTGLTARLQIRSDDTSDTVLVSLTEADGIDIDDSAKTITFTLDAADTEDYDFSEGVLELEVQDSDGVVTQLLRRDIVVEEEVVKPAA